MKIDKSYTNKFAYRVKIQDLISNYYFEDDNNLKLDYYINFNYNQLAEIGYDIDDERNFF